MPRVSIVIPAFNRAALTRRCLDALLSRDTGIGDAEIIVVDDGSTDSTGFALASFGEGIRVVTHATTTGFATACNDGASVAAGEYLVFLNNDTLPHPGWLAALVTYADRHPQAAAVGSKLLFPDGAIQHAGVVIGHDGYPHHIYAGFPSDHPAVNKSRRFQVVTGACVLVRREAFHRVGGFDAAFRNGFEDVDLCLRLGEQGHEIHYCHESVLVHLESASRARRSKETERNVRVYESRWLGRVEPDDVRYYIEDGLLRIGYDDRYPVRLAVSPRLAVLDDAGRMSDSDRLLHAQSQQVAELMHEIVRLTALAAELELSAVRRDGFGMEDALPGRDAAAAAGSGETSPSDNGDAGTAQAASPESFRRKADEIELELYDLQVALAVAVDERKSSGQGGSSDVAGGGFTASPHLAYRRLIREIRETVQKTIPPGATVLVVSRGDDRIVDLPGCRGWHFPQGENGSYSGHHPMDSGDAIARLERLRVRGAEYLIFPRTAFWWLDHYASFKRHIEERYPAIVWKADGYVIYHLSPGRAR